MKFGSLNNSINWNVIQANALHHQKQFERAKPFPHLILDNFFRPKTLLKTQKEFIKAGSNTLKLYTHPNAVVTSSIGLNNLSPHFLEIIQSLQSREFLKYLRVVSSEPELEADKNLAQGGILSYPKGNFVNFHHDNLTHPFDHYLHSKLTLLIYLNDYWPDNNKGALQLFDTKEKKVTAVTPKANRCLLMKIGEDCIHGLPTPLDCPLGIKREAIVLWYYTRSKTKIFCPTKYFPEPGASLKKRAQVSLGNFVLKGYYVQRKVFGDWDPVITKVMESTDKFGKFLKCLFRSKKP